MILINGYEKDNRLLYVNQFTNQHIKYNLQIVLFMLFYFFRCKSIKLHSFKNLDIFTDTYSRNLHFFVFYTFEKKIWATKKKCSHNFPIWFMKQPEEINSNVISVFIVQYLSLLIIIYYKWTPLNVSCLYVCIIFIYF